MIILGISAFYHDSAVAIVRDGRIISAAQEERFSRKKHDASFPSNALDYCLRGSGLVLKDVDFVVFYDKPFLKFERLVETYLAFAPSGFRSFRSAIPIWLRQKLYLKNLLIKELRKYYPSFCESRLLFSEHHLSHAASAFFPSPFQDAAVLTLDGVGEWATTSLAIGSGNKLDIKREIHFPHSLGLLYSAFTFYLGFKINSGEYKVMGLAPYGKPIYANKIYDHIIDLKHDGTFRLDLSYFNYCAGLTMTSKKFDRLFGGQPRNLDSPLTQRHMDLAASIQSVTEDVILRLTCSIAKGTGMKNLCLAGGVALNCVANGKIMRAGYFDKLWIQPASGDAGGALGAALAIYYLYRNQPREVDTNADSMMGSYLGPAFTQEEIEQRLIAADAKYEVLAYPELFKICANEISEGKAIGWFQGRMEFGPRALGGRSILGDPRSPVMQKLLNNKIKYRESFRPFAPSVLREDASDWFEIHAESPYMLLVADIAKDKRLDVTKEEHLMQGLQKLNITRSQIPAVTHVDYSARIQTVDERYNPLYYGLISSFKELTGCPILINTSFNIRGEPIVCTPEDAFKCFMGTEIDILVIGNCLLRKEWQQSDLSHSYQDSFELD